jgi:hypothetical protein
LYFCFCFCFLFVLLCFLLGGGGYMSLSLFTGFGGIRIAQSLVFFVVFCRSCVLLSFGHCVVCSSLIYIFWLPFWYLYCLFSETEMYILHSQLMLNLFFALSCLCCYCREEFEDTKRVIRICISKKNRQLTTSVVIGTDCIGSCKSNYHAITTTTVHERETLCIYLFTRYTC